MKRWLENRGIDSFGSFILWLLSGGKTNGGSGDIGD